MRTRRSRVQFTLGTPLRRAAEFSKKINSDNWDPFASDKVWWSKVAAKIPDDEVWAWIEEIHGPDITERVMYGDYYDDGSKIFGYVDNTHICRVIMHHSGIPHWAVIKAVRYWIENGWELPSA